MQKSIEPKTRRNSVNETIEVNKQKSPKIIELLIVISQMKILTIIILIIMMTELFLEQWNKVS